MKFNKFLAMFAVAVGVMFSANISAQEETKEEEKKPEGYQFTDVNVVKSTSAKDQNRAGTCWSYSTLGLVEAEMIRLEKEEVDLSEMFVVRYTYIDKAIKYVRMHGTVNFGGGGAVNDPIDVIKKYGMVPEENYKGLSYGMDNHVHGEMDNILKAYLDAVIKNKNKKLSTAWLEGYKGILDAYLGKTPETFTYNGKEYTPKTFAKDVVGINPDDYVYLTSYTHHPFYKPFAIEVQDNWSWSDYYNLPIDKLMDVFTNAIETGYTIGWASDISEKGFSFKKGVAVVPEDDIKEMADSERTKWEALSKKELKKMLFSFDEPKTERKITQEIRQEAFDNYQTTDDHGMLITGVAKDQNDTKYFKVKNSWGTDHNDYKGFFYASETFVKYKTMSIVLHKDALPKSIAKKLGL